MLNFKTSNIVFILLLSLLIGCHFVFQLSLWYLLLIVFLYSLLIFYGCYHVGSNFFIPVICSAKTNKKEIAISFDDGPLPSFTPAILQILKEESIEAAFFCIGKRVVENKHLIQQVSELGHVIGNHSFSHHFFFDMFSSNKMLADMQQANESIENATGLSPKLFRPPYGVTNPNLAKAIRNGNYIPIGWNVRSMDTVMKDEKKLLQKMNAALKPGAIFLFHDSSHTTLQMLQAFIIHAKKQGYAFTRLDKMLHLNPYV